MINGLIHPGSGLGNQLHRYVATRVLALDRDDDFCMIGRENFKGHSFMDLEMGFTYMGKYHTEKPAGKIVVDEMEKSQGYNLHLWEEKTPYYNPEFNFIEAKTSVVIDGEFQSIQYFGHRMKEIDEWLKVKPIDIPDDVCIIGFRGGEFALFPELFLTPDYWAQAMDLMLNINPNMRFEVHTDDFDLATAYFPGFKVIHDIGINWRSMRYATHAIIANSSFYIFPRLLSKGITIAPKGWARHNIKEWSRPDNFYREFTYI